MGDGWCWCGRYQALSGWFGSTSKWLSSLNMTYCMANSSSFFFILTVSFGFGISLTQLQPSCNNLLLTVDFERWRPISSIFPLSFPKLEWDVDREPFSTAYCLAAKFSSFGYSIPSQQSGRYHLQGVWSWYCRQGIYSHHPGLISVLCCSGQDQAYLQP